MKTATAKLVRLLESIPSGSSLRVDRDAGTIFGVKILGRSSPNRHGLRNVEGTDYTPEALAGAVRLYEGIKVNCDHPQRETPGADRSALDRLGKLVNVRMEQGEIYGDLKLLKSHPMAARLFEAAESMPDLFGLSHNALGRGEVKDGRYRIAELVEVRSVDVVADAGTTRSLFESKEAPMKRKLRALLESSKAAPKLKRRLLEMADEGYMTDMADMETAPEAADTGDWKQSLVDAIGKLVSSDSPEDHDMARKIMNMLKPATASTSSDTTADTTESDDSDDDDDKEEKETVESLRRDLADLRRKDAVRDLCEAENVKLAPVHFKAACLIESEADRKEYVRGFRELRESYPRSLSTPRTGTNRIGVPDVKDSKSFAEAILN